MQNKFKAVKTIFIVILVSVVLLGALGLTVHLIRKNSETQPEPIPSSCSVEISNFEFGHSSSGSYSLCSSKETDELIKNSIAEYGYFDVNITLDIDTTEMLQWEFHFTSGANLSDKMEVLANELDSRKAVIKVKDLSVFPITGTSTLYLYVYNSDRTQSSSFVFDMLSMSNIYFYDTDAIVELPNFEFGIISAEDSPYLINSKETYAKLVNSIESKGYFDISVQLDCDTAEQLSWQLVSTSVGFSEEYLEVIVDKEDSRKAVIRIKNIEVSYLPIVSVSNSNDKSYIYVQVLDFGDVLFLF